MAKVKYAAEHYSYRVGWSEEDQVYVARVAEFPSLAAHGDTLESALKQITSVVGAVLKDLARAGEEIPEPLGKRVYSGKLNLRLPAYLHRELSIEAAHEGMSLNQLIVLKAESR
jgi:predicted RNase H-like HicB family nuclease